MFKVCFRNLYKNFKYVFVEIGFMYLALMLGFDLFVKKVGIGFSEFIDAFKQLADSGNVDLLEEGFNKIVQRFAEGAEGFFAIQIVGLVLVFILVMFMMRSNVEKRNIFKLILSTIVDAIIIAILIILCTLLMQAASWGPIVVLILFLPLYSLFTLVSSYINHGLKLVDFKKAVSFSNIMKLAIGNFITIVVLIAVGLLVFLITNVLVGLTVTIALIMEGICTISLNADSYVNELVANAKVDNKIEKAKEETIKELTEKDEQEGESK